MNDGRKGGMDGQTEPETQPVETTVHVLVSRIFQIGGMSNFEELQYELYLPSKKPSTNP